MSKINVMNALFGSQNTTIDAAQEVAAPPILSGETMDLGLHADTTPKKKRIGGALRGSAYLAANPNPAHELTEDEQKIKNLIAHCEDLFLELELMQEELADKANELMANLPDEIAPFVCSFDTTADKPFDVAHSAPQRYQEAEPLVYEQFPGVELLAHVPNMTINPDDLMCQIYPFNWTGEGKDLKTTHAWPPSLEKMRESNGYKVVANPAPAPRPFLINLGVKGAQIVAWKADMTRPHPFVIKARELEPAFAGDSASALKTLIRWALKGIVDEINAPTKARRENKRWLQEYAGATDGAKWPTARTKPADKPAQPATPPVPDAGVEIDGM